MCHPGQTGTGLLEAQDGQDPFLHVTCKEFLASLSSACLCRASSPSFNPPEAPRAVIPKLQMGRLRPKQAAALQGPENVSCPVSQEGTPSPPSLLCPHTLLHQPLVPTSSKGPPWGRPAAPGTRRQDREQVGTCCWGWWASTVSQRRHQSRLQALGLGMGSGSWVSWTGGCRGAEPARWKELSFCTRGMTTAKRPGLAWSRSPALGRGPRATVGAKGAEALGSVPHRRHGGHVALIWSEAASGLERLSLSAFRSEGASLEGVEAGGSGSVGVWESPGQASSSGFLGLGLADSVSCPGPGSWCLPRKTRVESEAGSSAWRAGEGTGPPRWSKELEGTRGGLEKPRRLPGPPGQGEGGRWVAGMSTSQLGASGGTVPGVSESSVSPWLSGRSGAAAAACQDPGPCCSRKGWRGRGFTALVGGSLRRRHVRGRREGRLSERCRGWGPSRGGGEGGVWGPSKGERSTPGRGEARHGDGGSRSERGRRGGGEKGGRKGTARMEGCGDRGPRGEQ